MMKKKIWKNNCDKAINKNGILLGKNNHVKDLKFKVWSEYRIQTGAMTGTWYMGEERGALRWKTREHNLPRIRSRDHSSVSYINKHTCIYIAVFVFISSSAELQVDQVVPDACTYVYVSTWASPQILCMQNSTKFQLSDDKRTESSRVGVFIYQIWVKIFRWSSITDQWGTCPQWVIDLLPL